MAGDPYKRDRKGRRVNSRGEVLDTMGNKVDDIGPGGYQNLPRADWSKVITEAQENAAGYKPQKPRGKMLVVRWVMIAGMVVAIAYVVMKFGGEMGY